MGVSVPQRLAFTVWYRCVLWAGGSSAPRGLAPGSPATPEAVPARSQQIAPRVQARALIAGTAPSGMTLPQAAHTALVLTALLPARRDKVSAVGTPPSTWRLQGATEHSPEVLSERSFPHGCS